MSGDASPFSFKTLFWAAFRFSLNIYLVLPRIELQGVLLRLKGMQPVMRPRATSPMTIRKSPPGPKRGTWLIR